MCRNIEGKMKNEAGEQKNMSQGKAGAKSLVRFWAERRVA